MTLIVSVEHEDVALPIYLADCLISRTKYEKTNAEITPIHWRTDRQAETRGVGLSSKAYIHAGNIMLWSNRKLQARGGLKLLQDPNNLSIEAFEDALDQVYRCDKERESYLYSFKAEGRINSRTFGPVNERSIGKIKIVFAGSGSDAVADLIDEFKIREPSSYFYDPETVKLFVADLLGYLLRREFDNPYHCEQAFGGAYEIFMPDESGSYTRVPYDIVELTCESTRAEDGAYELDRPVISRVVKSVPYNEGCVFSVFMPEENEVAPTGSFVKPSAHFVCRQPFAPNLGSMDPLKMLRDLYFEAIPAFFSVIFIRHTVTNFRIEDGPLLKMEFVDESLVLTLDSEKFNAAMKEILKL